MLRNTVRHKRNPAPAQTLLILLNKPFGVVSQFSGDDRTLSELINVKQVYPAGRLDKDSEGLLLLTNNGKLQDRIASPKHKMDKVYQVQVEGTVDQSQLDSLTQGITLKDGPASAVNAALIDEPADLWPRQPPVRFRKTVPTSWIEVTLRQGRNRQVRRMTAQVGLPTLRLIRRRIGEWSIDQIPCGKFQTKKLSNDALRAIVR